MIVYVTPTLELNYKDHRFFYRLFSVVELVGLIPYSAYNVISIDYILKGESYPV